MQSGVVQLFDWTFDEIRQELCQLRDDGFSHVHVSPPALSNGADAWWGRYQPLDLRVIESRLGTEAQFVEMTREAERCQMQIVVDVVLNHAANIGLSSQELYYPKNCDRSRPAGDGPTACLWKPEHFHRQECIQNYNDHCNVLYGRICGGGADLGLPDLQTGSCDLSGVLDIRQRNYSPHVLATARTYLLKLLALGAKGFRFDAAKHVHPAFLEDLVSTPGIAGQAWVYSEVITDRTTDPAFVAYRHLPGVDFMDFPLTRTLQQAFGFGGSLRTLSSAMQSNRALDPDTSVSFVTNHDVWGNDSGLGYRFGSFTDEWLAHVYIFGRESGVPYLYSELPTRSESRRYRRPEESYVLFHRRNDIRGMSRFHAAVLTKSQRTLFEDDARLAFARGDDALVVLNKSGVRWNLRDVRLAVKDGVYFDMLRNETFEIRNERVDLDVSERSAMMLLRIAETARPESGTQPTREP
jgi:alpha-amylase